MLRGADPKSKQDGSAHRGQQNKSSTVIYLARIRLRLHLNEMATLRARLAMVSDSRDAEKRPNFLIPDGRPAPVFPTDR